MDILWGAILIVFTLIICWLGQIVNSISPTLAVRLGIDVPEDEVDPTFFLDGRGEAVWDALILWTLPLAGVLLLLDSPWWAYFGLVGGGMYLYFAGRGIAQRLVMQRRGVRIGEPAMLKTFYVMLALWGLIGAITIVMAVMALESG